MLSVKNATLHSQWETEHEKCAKLSAELEKLQLNYTETETLRTELARQPQATAKWRQAQSDLKISAEAHDAPKIFLSLSQHSPVNSTLNARLLMDFAKN
jgi:hypothetical protein